MPELASLNLRPTADLRNKIDGLVDQTGLPVVRVVEALLRDALGMPPVYRGLATKLRKMAKET